MVNKIVVTILKFPFYWDVLEQYKNEWRWETLEFGSGNRINCLKPIFSCTVFFYFLHAWFWSNKQLFSYMCTHRFESVVIWICLVLTQEQSACCRMQLDQYHCYAFLLLLAASSNIHEKCDLRQNNLLSSLGNWCSFTYKHLILYLDLNICPSSIP